MKYLIVGTKTRHLKRSYYTTSLRFANEHPDDLDVVMDTSIQRSDFKQLSEKYKKIIFRQECPSSYHFHINPVILSKIPHTIYIKNDFCHPIYNSCTTGFSYYKNNPKIKNFVPIITDYPKIEDKTTDKPCIGFHGRIWLIKDSYKYLIQLIKDNYGDVDICILGDRVFDLGKFSYYTYDSEEFFSHITHFLYPRSSTYIDVTSHALIEAVQLNKQIIIPDISGREHQDGVDDTASCIRYHKHFDPNKKLDNYDNILTAAVFKKFYNQVFNNDWNYPLDRTKYKTFRDWIEGELL